MKPVMCWFAISAFGAVGLCAQAQENLLRNPGFEQGERGPTGWVFNHRHTDGEITWDKTHTRAGEASARIENRTEAETGNVFATLLFDPPLEPGSRVGFSAYAACQDAGGTGPLIVVSLRSTSGACQDASARCPGGTHDFVEVRGEAVMQRPTQSLVIYLCHYGTGTVWWDDACVTVQLAKPSRIVPRRRRRESMRPLTTDDGLAITFSDAGGVDALRLDGQMLPAPTDHTGLWLRPFDGDVVPVAGKLTAEDGAIVQRFEDAERGLRVTAYFAAGRRTIQCVGAVEDLTGEDRGVDLFFALPVGGRNWRWGKSIREEVPLARGPQTLAVTTFSSVADPQTGEGIALAVPADSSCDCEFTHDAEFGYVARFRFGLSSAAAGKLRSRAPFSFVIYHCDGRWGLRDAARRYYESYPWAFQKRVKREGLWMFGSPRFAIPDPQNYAFHEGGPNGWEYDDRHRIYTCPYIIPGQREITQLEELPASKEEAMEIFRTLGGPGKPPVSPRAGRPPAWKPSSHAIVANCLLHDRQGLPQIRIRNTSWGGNSITFPLNADPRLFDHTDKATIAKTLLSSVAQMHENIPGLDGTYVDSLGAWGNYWNHRRDHFPYAQVPLTYDPANGKPVIHNRFSLLEFLWALRDYLHARDKLLFANGVHRNRRFHFFALDVMGVEGHGDLEQKRVMGYQKPFLLLIYNIHDDPAKMEHYYHLCTFYGIYPSFAHMRVYETPESYAPVAQLNDRFVPVLRTMTSAGWQPITYARSSDPAVWLERWGPDGNGTVYLSVYNANQNERRSTITIDADSLGLRAERMTLEDLLCDETWEAVVHDGLASVPVAVPSHKSRVLSLKAKNE